MSYGKYLTLTCFILAFVVSGCGEKADKEEARERPVTIEEREISVKEPIPRIEPVRVPVGQKDTGTSALMVPPARETTKMVEPIRVTELKEGEVLVSDFESWPNNLGGEIGVHGALEPDWEQVNLYPVAWVYEPITLGYDPANVHSGKNSFRLVNGLGLKRDLMWGSFSMDLGPATDLTVVPKKLESLDVSGYKYLIFWAKGEKGGEKMELLLRSAHALNYNPEVRHKLPDLTAEWQKIAVSLEEFSGKVDLSQLDNVSLGFGKDVGNMEGDIAYIDDFVFTNNP